MDDFRCKRERKNGCNTWQKQGKKVNIQVLGKDSAKITSCNMMSFTGLMGKASCACMKSTYCIYSWLLMIFGFAASASPEVSFVSFLSSCSFFASVSPSILDGEA